MNMNWLMMALGVMFYCRPSLAVSDNLALDQPVSGINLVGGGEDTYQFLVDGNKDTCADSGRFAVGPGFRIDLGDEYLIEGVQMTFASTCDSISKYGCYFFNTVVEVSESDNYDESKECVFLESTGGKENGELSLECSDGPITGRYVTLRKKTEGLRTIYLCELQVYGQSLNPEEVTEVKANVEQTTLAECELTKTLVNVAPGKKAVQSSTAGSDTADKAIDGNKDSDLQIGKSCIRTKKEFQPWWKVDLGSAYDVYQIIITNRQDCCHFRIKNAQIRVGKSPDFEENAIFGQVDSDAGAAVETIVITRGCYIPMTGRYVSIQLVDVKQVLNICEVEILVA
ncbi:uncharacterized protein [Ptychodera flava]|uniref:uncharacterized protein n=1 Tax=Ptychodera flava TaxID=63121 RepID=UPI003969C72D